MRFGDERYVRLYRRDTPGWLMMAWQGRALWPLMLRVLDRAGIFEMGKHGVAGLAAAVRLPLEVVEPGLAALLANEYVVQAGSTLTAPNYVEAQEAPTSDRQRKREQRDRDRRDQLSRAVTTSHEESQEVTKSHSDPIRAEPNRTKRSKSPRCAVAQSAPETQKGEEPTKGSIEKAASDRVCEHYKRVWLASRLPLDGIPPKVATPDYEAARSLLRRFGEAAAIGLVDRYLTDADPWLVKQGHQLRLIGSRVDAYRAQAKPPPAREAIPVLPHVAQGQGGSQKL